MNSSSTERTSNFMVRHGSTVVCLGDSITEAADGYVKRMSGLIRRSYPKRRIRIVNAGVSGNRAPDMVARLDRDVIAHRPDWVTVSAGINDVWHGFADGDRSYPDGSGPRGVPLDTFEEAISTIVGRLRESGASVALLTPTVIGEDVDNPANLANVRLKGYVAAMRRVADSSGAPFVDLHDRFVTIIRKTIETYSDFRLTTDGVHLNNAGNLLVALAVLKALGWSFEDLIFA